ncbi:MAG: hypothetical protein ACLRXC_04620 [[Clostridium] leptum]
MKVSAITLGCKVNQYETQAMLARLQAAGFTLAKRKKTATLCLSIPVQLPPQAIIRWQVLRRHVKAPTAVIA